MAKEIKIPVITSLSIEDMSAGVAGVTGSSITNGVIMKYPDGGYYVTQRPSFTTFNATAAPASRGRGIYYWEAASKLFIVNDNKLYANDYNVEITPAGTETAMSSGYRKVFFTELAGQLFIIDPSNNKGKYLLDNTATTFYDMKATPTTAGDSFAYFPPNNGKTLASGVAVLDKTMYVLTTDGEIWGSDLNDGGSWTDSANFLTAEMEEDSAVHIDKHHDNIVVFGRRTIEFFYDAANPTGSPLAPRGDISYNIGCADPDSVWRVGDDIYFLGIDTSGELGAYVLSAFKIEKISDSTVTSFITTSKSVDGISTTASGLSTGNNTYYILTSYNLISGSISPSQTGVYNAATKTWSLWEHSDSNITAFPLVTWTITDDSRIGEGVLSSGELISVADNFNPSDSKSTEGYIDSSYISDYYIASSSISNNIKLVIRINNWSGESGKAKYMSQLRWAGDSTSEPQTITVRWSDGNNRNYTSGRTLDISNLNNKLTRLGRFKNRSFEFEYSGNEQIRMEGFYATLEEGNR